MNELMDVLVLANSVDEMQADGFLGAILIFLVMIQGIVWVAFVFILPFYLISILQGINERLRRGSND